MAFFRYWEWRSKKLGLCSTGKCVLEMTKVAYIYSHEYATQLAIKITKFPLPPAHAAVNKVLAGLVHQAKAPLGGPFVPVASMRFTSRWHPNK